MGDDGAEDEDEEGTRVVVVVGVVGDKAAAPSFVSISTGATNSISGWPGVLLSSIREKLRGGVLRNLRERERATVRLTIGKTFKVSN